MERWQEKCVAVFRFANATTSQWSAAMSPNQVLLRNKFQHLHALTSGLRVLVLAIVLATSPALVYAQTESPPSGEPSYVDNQTLDALFLTLAEAPNQAEATLITNQIWQVWFTPLEPDLADRMALATMARQTGNAPRAILILNRIIADYPGYAEAWNQRATMFFLVGDFDASLADVDEVLAREPRHFGALSGAATMYLRRGERALALKTILLGLQYHPFLTERALFEELLEPPINT